MADPLRDRCREALRRNALLSGVLEEGYSPTGDAVLRERVRTAMKAAVRRRRARLLLLGVTAAAVTIAALAIPHRTPAPELPAAVPVAAPPGILQIVTTADARPRYEIVPTSPVSSVEVVRTAQLIGPLERARDEELLASGGVVGIVGHPGGPRKLILGTPVPHRFLE